jgi:hypothetical protein
MPTTTPKTLDHPTKTFCRSLNRDADAVFVDVEPTADAVSGECFYNVRQLSESKGGTLIYGWRVWSWPGVFIEAEHHAIWCQLDGALLDITPTPHGEKRILFVQDDSLTFDFDTHHRRDNVRHALNNDSVVKEYLKVSAEINALMEKYSEGRKISLPRNEIQPLFERLQTILHIMYKNYLGPNSLCTCNSGRKVKKCCGLEQAINAPFNYGRSA